MVRLLARMPAWAIAPSSFSNTMTFSIFFGLGLWSLQAVMPAVAQIIPDTTLGAEFSVVRPGVVIRGENGSRIDGGATRGANLFHSFEQFNVGDGQRVYFANPAGIERIMGRVTGRDVSNIFGTLGVEGTADLFLMNPNGIIFGENSRLDVAGSFMATTADALVFGDRDTFSTINPTVPPPLLTIQPSALFFNQLNPGPIIHRSATGNPMVGLNVPNGEQLALIGGAVNLEGSQIIASEGRVDIGAVAGVGTVAINADSSVTFLDELVRGDVVIDNAQVNVAGGGGGHFTITAKNLEVRNNSLLLAGIAEGLGGVEAIAGDILIDADQTIQVTQSDVDNSVAGTGQAGTIQLNAGDRITLLDGGRVISNVNLGGMGDSGDIIVNTDTLQIRDRSILRTDILGQGNGGNITVTAGDRVLLDSSGFITSFLRPSGVGNTGTVIVTTDTLTARNLSSIGASASGQGNGGDIHIAATGEVLLDNARIASDITGVGTGGTIRIVADELEITNVSLLSTSTFGQGDAGNLLISVDGVLQLNNISQLSAIVGEMAVGQGGDIAITANQVEIDNFAQISASTFGRGNAGNITVEGGDRMGVDTSTMVSVVFLGAEGAAGDLRISADRLDISESALITSDTFGQGAAGNITLTGRDRVMLSNSTVSSRSAFGAVGDGGDIQINAADLTVADGATILASSFGVGDAGDIVLEVGDRILVDASLAGTSIEGSAVGVGGDIRLNTNVLTLRNGAQLVAGTFTAGDAGNITITAREAIRLRGGNQQGSASAIFTNTDLDATGNGGDIQITTPRLILEQGAVINARSSSGGNGGGILIESDRLTARNGGQIITTTFGGGDAGDISINAQEQVVLTGDRPPQTRQSDFDLVTEEEALTERLSNSIDQVLATIGNPETQLILEQQRTQLLDSFAVVDQQNRERIDQQLAEIATLADAVGGGESGLFANTQPDTTGNGGAIAINTPLLTMTDQGRILAGTQGEGRAGNIELSGHRIDLSDRATIAVSSENDSLAGSLRIRADDLRLGGRSQLAAETDQGTGANILLQVADQIDVRDNSQISTLTNGGIGGRLVLNHRGQPVSQLTLRNHSQMTTEAVTSGDGGNLEINASQVQLDRNATISASAQSGTGGDIQLAGLTRLHLSNNSRITAATQTGVAGNLTLTATDIVILDDNSSLSVEAAPLESVATPATNTTLSFSSLLNTTQTAGTAGNLTLQTPVLRVFNGSDITVASPDGQAGNITINANQIQVNQGTITAETGSNQGGPTDLANVILNRPELLLLQNDSLLSAAANGTASGGNIIIDAGQGFIVGDRLENNDIIATAVAGNGGNIQIAAARIFGMEILDEARRDILRRDPANNISASSQSGIDGVIVIEDLGTEPVQSAAELPTNPENPILTQGCQPGRDGSGSFINAERGGLPTNPLNPLGSDRGWEDIVRMASAVPSAELSDLATAPIAEAVGWYSNEQGAITLVTSETVSPKPQRCR